MSIFPVRSMTTILSVSTLVGLCCFSGHAIGAAIEPALAKKLAGLPDDSLVQVVIRPTGTVKPSELKSEIISRFSTRAEQHREVITRLMAAASEKQASIVDALRSSQYAGDVVEPRSYWIDNVIIAHSTKSGIESLSLRDDIESIQLMPDVTLVTPLSAGSASQSTQQTQNHIKAIKADSVWAAGYTGKGRLVGSLDTGVDGKHSALTNNWRGHNGGSVAASWHDPIYGDTIPRIYSGAGTVHGTQVMGLMVGVISGVNDTLGVCPDCEWISSAAIDIPCPGGTYPCSNLFDALQWIADPDGDPNTEWDVPDAIANPWGAATRLPGDGCGSSGIGCSNIFWNAIDNIEAAGALMVFAAGNEGQCGDMSIRNPANRIELGTQALSVGMVDARTNITTPLVDPLSSRGPSDCDGASIKPELTAPGVNLRTTTPNNGISTSAYGTSFATPLVAAGAAILREYNPNATVDQIRSALLAGAKDLGSTGPDNSYGHGMLDLMEAMRNLPPNTEPAVIVMRSKYEPPPPGTNAHIEFVLRNCGTPATGVEVELSSGDPRLSIVDGFSIFADMPAYGDSADNAEDPFEAVVHASCLPGERLPLSIAIRAAGGYSRTMAGAILIGPPGEAIIFTHDAGRFQLTVGAAGTFGHEVSSLSPRPGGVGYLYADDPTQSLFEGAFMIGAGPDQVSDNVRETSGSADVDFRIDPGGMLTVAEPGDLLAEETRSGFDDSYAENPIGLFIEQRTMASNLPGNGDYLIIEYTIHNRSSNILANLHCGLFFDWDFPYSDYYVASRDGGGFDASTEVGWMRDRTEGRFRGVCVLSETSLAGYKFFTNLTEVYDGISDAEKWQAMTGGTSHSLPVQEGDGSHAIGAGPFGLGYGDSTKVAFAVIGGTSETQIIESARLARLQYAATKHPLEVDILPGTCPNRVGTLEPIDISFPGQPKSSPKIPEVLVAILGTSGTPTVDATSIRLGSALPIRSYIQDVGMPKPVQEPGACECPTGPPDGVDDIVVAFARDDIVALIPEVGARALLTLRATTSEKTALFGTDCLTVTDEIPVYTPAASRVSKSRLGVNSPNPFNASTKISIAIEKDAMTKLDVFDVLGRRVTTLCSSQLSAGEHEFVWSGRSDDGRELPSGVYFARLTVSGSTEARMMVLLK